MGNRAPAGPFHVNKTQLMQSFCPNIQAVACLFTTKETFSRTGFFKRAIPHKMCNYRRICAVLLKQLCNSKVCYFIKGCKEVNSMKNDRFRYEIICETQLEMELLEVVTSTIFR